MEKGGGWDEGPRQRTYFTSQLLRAFTRSRNLSSRSLPNWPKKGRYFPSIIMLTRYQITAIRMAVPMIFLIIVSTFLNTISVSCYQHFRRMLRHW